MGEFGQMPVGRRRFLIGGAAGAAFLALPGVRAAALSPGRGLAQSSAPGGSGPGGAPEFISDFAPFVPSDAVGTVPDLPKRMAFAIPTANEYYTQIGNNIELGASDAGVEYQVLISDSDPVKGVDNLNSALQVGVGGLVVQPEDAAAQGVVLQQAIDDGVCVIFFVTPPSTVQTVADQYTLGYDQAVSTVKWIDENLGGTATVVNFTLDFIEALIPRRHGSEEGLATGGDGITVISQELSDITQDEGFTFASTLLQAHPEINVWIGPDDTMLGVNSYLESIGKDASTELIYCTGLAGSQAGKDAVAAGNTFLRAVWGFNDPLAGYAYGRFVGDWLAGKSIPQVILLGSVEMTDAAAVEAFDAILADPKAGFEGALAGDDLGVSFLGSISYDTKDDYLVNIIQGGG